MFVKGVPDFSDNTQFFNQENAFENVVWQMVAILFRPQCIQCQNSLLYYTGLASVWLFGCNVFYILEIKLDALSLLAKLHFVQM